MRSMVIVALLVLTALAILPVEGSAEDKAVNLSLFNPIQIFPEDTSVKYFRFSLIYGKNATLTGLDMGLVNHLTAGESKALQLGFVNYVEADLKGLQYGAVNATKGTFTGWQWGFVNYSGHTKGFMLGFVNYSESMYGLQIGLINIIKEGGMLPFFPIFNFSF
jgi:hypothetical protein